MEPPIAPAPNTQIFMDSLLGRLRLAPVLPAFLVEQTRVSVDLMLVDRPVRPAEKGIDVALRIGPLEDSALIVRKLDDIQLIVCAAPDYLHRRGEPVTDGRLKVVLEAFQRPPTPLSILALRNRLLLPKVRAFVDFLHQHWNEWDGAGGRGHSSAGAAGLFHR